MSAWTSSAATFPNIVPLSFQKLISPEFNFGPTADFLYGKCLFTGAGGSSFVLAEELAVAARSKMNQDSMPPRYKPLQPYEACGPSFIWFLDFDPFILLLS